MGSHAGTAGSGSGGVDSRLWFDLSVRPHSVSGIVLDAKNSLQSVDGRTVHLADQPAGSAEILNPARLPFGLTAFCVIDEKSGIAVFLRFNDWQIAGKKRRAKEPVKYHQEDKTNPGRFKRRRKETTWLSSLKAVNLQETKAGITWQ